VCADLDAGEDGLAGLRQIGIDEISYRRGHRYVLVVLDHERRRLVWAAPGTNKTTAHRFFDDLGEQRCRLSVAAHGALGGPLQAPSASEGGGRAD
jgi:transposase